MPGWWGRTEGCKMEISFKPHPGYPRRPLWGLSELSARRSGRSWNQEEVAETRYRLFGFHILSFLYLAMWKLTIWVQDDIWQEPVAEKFWVVGAFGICQCHLFEKLNKFQANFSTTSSIYWKCEFYYVPDSLEHMSLSVFFSSIAFFSVGHNFPYHHVAETTRTLNFFRFDWGN